MDTRAGGVWVYRRCRRGELRAPRATSDGSLFPPGHGKHRIRSATEASTSSRMVRRARHPGSPRRRPAARSPPRRQEHLDVTLKKGEKWRYLVAGRSHTVAWVALHEGKLATPEIGVRGRVRGVQWVERALEFQLSKTPASFWVRLPSIPSISCSAPARSIRVCRRSTEAKVKSRNSAADSAEGRR